MTSEFQNRTSSTTTAIDEVTSIFTDFDKNMETYIKKTPRLPTGAEFLADFENAFNTRLSDLGAGFGGLGSGGGLGPNEMEFARNVLFPALFGEYQSRLGDIAKTGASPFITAPGGKSTVNTRSSSGQSSSSRGTTNRGTASSSSGSVSSGDGSVATGGSEDESSTINFNRTETESGNVNENQVLEEDILLPKVMPLDFLAEVLTPAAIKVAYEGSRRGAGSFQSAGTGATVARRV